MVIKAQAEVEGMLARAAWIDQAAHVLQNAVRSVFESQGERGRQVRNFLNGVWLGHPLHAAVTDVPVGAWTTGFVLDLLGAISGASFLKRGGNWMTGVGIVGALGAAASGLADYSETYGEQRRYGTVHAMLNTTALLAYLVSFVRRLAGDHRGALPFSIVGYALAFVSADIGGLMVYRFGTMVNRESLAHGPRHWTAVLDATDVAEGKPKSVDVRGTKVMLARVNGQLFAIGDVCTHWGCSLAEGHLADTSVICACHGSQFGLADGQVINGPATSPEPSYDVRVNDGKIEIRERAY
jgi:nitrite reductase/ring-hydroxylating ferredoxin subunit/uncharacterized membrane protein